MTKSIIAALALMMLLATSALAGSATIYGAVHDKNTPLTGALVNIEGEATYTSQSTYTNEHGVYFFDKLPADEYIITAIPQPEGVYKDGTHNIFLGKCSRKEVNFSLKKK
ncbi:carboxypeptidase-like regulatory domain-containing protein [Pseudodesulfovibrio sp. zrk46]|uniref:carboxypeptidase-like regulatory domain-containing protein n=1 Tax=Pseudodesulfovibrio sp. zrk46 TaxID=2725288 RepID=UPI00144A0AD8|nr:carboxypeptidase-like regulatory domain-containing protein [Pseudodesulfovibrio sp. zrk46]QJB58272.1 carboxypeptidase regulatory-like domain-containing protein [Pseudodesulfovibrio sp. zrk46]